GNDVSWNPFTYDYIYRADRDLGTQTVEARMASAQLSDSRFAWLVGAYGANLRERIGEVSSGVLIDPDPINGYVSTTDDFLSSRFTATTMALFAQLEGRLSETLLWSFGVREEQRKSKYRDAGNWEGEANRNTADEATDNMLG